MGGNRHAYELTIYDGDLQDSRFGKCILTSSFKLNDIQLNFISEKVLTNYFIQNNSNGILNINQPENLIDTEMLYSRFNHKISHINSKGLLIDKESEIVIVDQFLSFFSEFYFYKDDTSEKILAKLSSQAKYEFKDNSLDFLLKNDSCGLSLAKNHKFSDLITTDVENAIIAILEDGCFNPGDVLSSTYLKHYSLQEL